MAEHLAAPAPARSAPIPRISAALRRGIVFDRNRYRRWVRYWISDTFYGVIYLALYHLLRRLPIDWSSAIGAALSMLVGRCFDRPAMARARRNYLRLAAAPVSDADADAAITRAWAGFGRVMAEFAVLDRLWPAGRIEVVGLHHLAQARDAGRPHLMMGLHTANWEVFGPAMHALGFPGKFTYMPVPNRFQNRIAVRARKDWGKALPPTLAGSREAYRTLVEERGALVIWVDEFIRGQGVTAPLFGRPVPPRCNLAHVVRLTLASRAALLPFYVERLKGARFRLTILPELSLTRSGEREADLRDNVERLDRLITPIVKARLEQWFLLPYLRLP